GVERAVAFRTFRKGGAALPDAEELIAAYAKHRSRVKGWVSQGLTDKLSALCHALKLHLQHPDHYKEVRGIVRLWKNLGGFLNDLPPDLADGVREFMRGRQYELPDAKPRRAKP